MKDSTLRGTARVLLSLLATLLAGCGATDMTGALAGDRVVPSASISLENRSGPAGLDSVSVRAPLRIRVQANDNLALRSVTTTVKADTTVIFLERSDVGLGKSFDRTLEVPLGNVRSGQVVTAAVQVQDGGGNTAAAQAAATAYDPTLPVFAYLQPAPSIFPGGQYSFRVIVRDSLGVTKVGYRAVGAGFTATDSVLFSAPLPRVDTILFRIRVPAGAEVGKTFAVMAFAENESGLRSFGAPVSVRVAAAGADVQAPLVQQSVPARMETPDSISISVRDPDGLVRVVGVLVRNAANALVYRSADTLAQPTQEIELRRPFGAPVSLRGQTLYITAYAIDAAGHTGYAIPPGGTIAVASEEQGYRSQVVYTYGLTYAMPPGSLGADIAVDTSRAAVYVSNVRQNKLEAWRYADKLVSLGSVTVGSQPWGMIIDNSNSLLLVANSGGTNISSVDLNDPQRPAGRIKTMNQVIWEVEYSRVTSGDPPVFKGLKFGDGRPKVHDFSDRPQYLAQSASGALYYSTIATAEAPFGTLRRIDDYITPVRAEPRQIWQYGTTKVGSYAVLNADAVSVIQGSEVDSIVICDHRPGDTATSQCVRAATPEEAAAQLRAAPLNADVEVVRDLDVSSLALPDTNFVAVGGDRRVVMFGEANTGNRAGRVLLVDDPSGTPPGRERYSGFIEIRDLTNNASDRIFGIAVNRDSRNFAVHGVETFFHDETLRLQGKFATFSSGAGIAFHPLNVGENTPDSTARVVFVASGDRSIQIVDSYTYRLRGRIPIRSNLYGPLRAVLPTAAERAMDPSLVVKLFGLTQDGIVLIDVRREDIDNVRSP
jgi:DNA-binding beta-propeller fold protein YncE